MKQSLAEPDRVVTSLAQIRIRALYLSQYQDQSFAWYSIVLRDVDCNAELDPEWLSRVEKAIPKGAIRAALVLLARHGIRAHKRCLAYFLQVVTTGKQVVVVCNQGGSLDTKSGNKFGFPSRWARGSNQKSKAQRVSGCVKRLGSGVWWAAAGYTQIAQGGVLPQGGGLQARNACGGRSVSACQAMGIAHEHWRREGWACNCNCP
jgi:hypothetical protein